MAISTRPRRTVSDIKTHSGRANGNRQEVYRDYFQVGALELERWRRTKEREAAAARIVGIDNRMAEINAEKEQLLASAAAACASYDNSTQSADKKRTTGLRIKY